MTYIPVHIFIHPCDMRLQIAFGKIWINDTLLLHFPNTPENSLCILTSISSPPKPTGPLPSTTLSILREGDAILTLAGRCWKVTTLSCCPLRSEVFFLNRSAPERNLPWCHVSKWSGTKVLSMGEGKGTVLMSYHGWIFWRVITDPWCLPCWCKNTTFTIFLQR